MAEVDGQYLYCINDCAIEEDCFACDQNTAIIEADHLYGLVDVMSGEILLEPIYPHMADVEERIAR